MIPTGLVRESPRVVRERVQQLHAVGPTLRVRPTDVLQNVGLDLGGLVVTLDVTNDLDRHASPCVFITTLEYAPEGAVAHEALNTVPPVVQTHANIPVKVYDVVVLPVVLGLLVALVLQVVVNAPALIPTPVPIPPLATTDVPPTVPVVPVAGRTGATTTTTGVLPAPVVSVVSDGPVVVDAIVVLPIGTAEGAVLLVVGLVERPTALARTVPMRPVRDVAVDLRPVVVLPRPAAPLPHTTPTPGPVTAPPAVVWPTHDDGRRVLASVTEKVLPARLGVLSHHRVGGKLAKQAARHVTVNRPVTSLAAHHPTTTPKRG
mmetsp:Transcript_46290/g.115150  ORF Transcript_46290/g.115150 Transcript_46290/m.115150 type:complete len:318 (-) Transcript_46290:65-1018(-)